MSRRTVDGWLGRFYIVATRGGSEEKRNVPSRFYPGLGLLENSIGSAYGSRTRDLRLERAASLATRRMRLTKDYIITPLPLFVKDDCGALGPAHILSRADRARHVNFCLALPAIACISSIDACIYSLRKSIESSSPL